MTIEERKEPMQFIISERPNGLGLSVMKRGATFHQTPDRIYYSVVEAWALQAERERSRKLIERLRYVTQQVEMSEAARDAIQAIISVYFEARP